MCNDCRYLMLCKFEQKAKGGNYGLVVLTSSDKHDHDSTPSLTLMHVLHSTGTCMYSKQHEHDSPPTHSGAVF